MNTSSRGSFFLFIAMVVCILRASTDFVVVVVVTGSPTSSAPSTSTSSTPSSSTTITTSKRVRTKYDVDYEPGTFLTGRATYFDATNAWKTKWYDHHEFGYLETNACGYTSKVSREKKRLPLAVDRRNVAALADFETKSSCGQCYEIKCDDYSTSKIRKTFRNENDFIAYNDNFTKFESLKNKARDSYGRLIDRTNPPAEFCNGSDGKLCEKTTCYDRDKTLVVQIIDICPCDYIYGRQEICCGDIPHFDLSFWAFELLAHPMQGKMNLMFRPVNCLTQDPLDAREGALAHVRKNGNKQYVVYDGRTPIGLSPGWRYRTWFDQKSDPAKEGMGVDGGFAMCAEFEEKGTQAAVCFGCSDNLPFNINNELTELSFRIQLSSLSLDLEYPLRSDDDLCFFGEIFVALEKRQERDATREYSETNCARKIQLLGDDVNVLITSDDENDENDGEFSCARTMRISIDSFGCKEFSVNPNAIIFEYYANKNKTAGNITQRRRSVEVCVSNIVLF